MKIAYLLQQTGVDPASNGVIKKVVNTATTWIDMGCDVTVFLLCSKADSVQSVFPSVPIVALEEKPPGRLYIRRFQQFHELVRAISSFGPDLVYLRFGIFYPSFLTMMARFPCVVEVNGDDEELRYYGGATKFYHRLTRSRWFAFAQGFIFVTGELSRFPHMKFSGPVAVIPNGIDLSLFPEKVVSTSEAGAQPRLVFMGSGTVWHGLDHLAELAKRKSDWSFDVIGPISDRDLPANVLCHGKLNRGEYIPILQRADLSVGTLAMYRAGLEEACTLKVREYLACGLPVLIGHKDADFDNSEFILRIPNTENAIETSLTKIEGFVARWCGRVVPREEIGHLDTRVKEQKRLQFLRGIVRSQG